MVYPFSLLLNILRKTQPPPSLFHLTSRIQEFINYFYKKKEKRILKMFSKKPICPSLKSTYHFSIFQEIQKSKGLRSRSYKKERKENIRNVLKKAYSSNPKVHLPFQKN